jgi:hypothetical protein
MFNRPVSDASSAPGLVGASPARAELAVTTPSGSVELPAQAVAETGAAHGIQEDHHRLMHDAGNIGRVRATVDDVFLARKQRAELEELRAKLVFNGKRAADDRSWSEEVEAQSRQVLELIASLESAVARQSVKDQMRAPSQSDNVFKLHGRLEVLGKIEAALAKVGTLREKLTKNEAHAFESLLGLNLSLSSLNTARSLVQETPFSQSAAATAVDNVLVNVRATIAAHGKISPDLVRLIINL